MKSRGWEDNRRALFTIHFNMWTVSSDVSRSFRKFRSFFLVPRNTQKSKNVIASIRCHGNSDVNKRWIITNFHLYIVQLWQIFADIFVNADVVNAQSGEVYSLKNPVETPFNAEESSKLISRLHFGIKYVTLMACKLVKGMSFYVSW